MSRGYSFTVVLLAALLIVVVFLLILPMILNPPGPGIDNRQKAQLHQIDTVLEIFEAISDSHPPSKAMDPVGQPYCGAMKLCETIMGRDLLGFHRDSVFRSDGMDATNTKKLYTPDPKNLKARRGPYLPLENANVYRLKDIYEDVGPFDGNNYVICSIYTKKRHSDKKTGMPILYYKANTSQTAHDVNDPNNPKNIYNYKDNHALLALGVPGEPGKNHPLFEDPRIFYEMTRDHKVTTLSIPNRQDSYILLSAGKDGLYGTEDDIGNFSMRWKPKQKGKGYE